jgi:hypothetical protein
MPSTFDSALDDELVTVLMRDDSKGLFVIRLGELPQDVEIQLGREMDNEGTHFSVSHAIKTPLQAGPYRTSRPWGDYPAYALQQAITGLTMYYRQGIEAGHAPNESWLVDY